MKYYFVKVNFDTLAGGRVFQRFNDLPRYYCAESFSELLQIIDKQLVSCGGPERDFHSMEIKEVSEEEAKNQLSNWNTK